MLFYLKYSIGKHIPLKKNGCEFWTMLEEIEESPEVAIIAANEVFKTYELICLDKLKEIGRTTAREWSFAMGYTHRSSLAKIIKRIEKRYPDKLKIYDNRFPRLYEAL